MKQLLLVALGILSINLCAQITVTSDIYPQIGDTLRVMNANVLGSEDAVSAAGPDQTWDYSGLEEGLILETSYIAVEETGFTVGGAISATELPTGGFVYYGETMDHFGTLALNQEVPLPGIDLVFARYDEPLADYHAELNYDMSIDNQTSLVSSGIPGDLIPSELLDSLGLPISPDSIRIEQTYGRNSTVDAWGEITTPTGTYDVLREHRENLVTNSIGIYAGFLGWITIPLGDVADTTTQYIYWSNDHSEPIMTQTVDGQGITTAIQYYTDQRLTSTEELADRSLDSKIFPNPTSSGTIRLDIPAELSGLYRMSWYDAQGRLMEVKDQELLAGGQNISIPQLAQSVVYLVARSERLGVQLQHRIMIGR